MEERKSRLGTIGDTKKHKRSMKTWLVAAFLAVSVVPILFVNMTAYINTSGLVRQNVEATAYDFDNYRYHQGTNLRIGNLYPVRYAQAFYEGQEREGQENIVNLLRCAWAGSQRYGALVWSGDISSSFESMRGLLLRRGQRGVELRRGSV